MLGGWQVEKGFIRETKEKNKKAKFILVEGYEGSDVLQTTSKVDTPSLGHES